MNQANIRNIDQLKRYIFDRRTGSLFHFTSYESLVMILKNRSLRISRYDLLNDIAEKELSKCSDGDTRYISSFTGTSTENVAMWALYGRHSSLKMRLGFKRDSLIKTIDNNFYFDSGKKNKIPLYGTSTIPHDCSKKEYSISDVVYYDKDKNLFRLSEKAIPTINVTDEDIHSLAGTIKYDAWEYEKEVRLSVILHHPKNDEHFIDERFIYAGLSDEFISGLSITYSPWINDELMEVLANSINDLAECKLNHKKSTLQGEITEL